MIRETTWCVSYEFNYFGTQLDIVVRDLKLANDWCSKNVPLGIRYNLKLEE